MKVKIKDSGKVSFFSSLLAKAPNSFKGTIIVEEKTNLCQQKYTVDKDEATSVFFEMCEQKETKISIPVFGVEVKLYSKVNYIGDRQEMEFKNIPFAEKDCNEIEVKLNSLTSYYPKRGQTIHLNCRQYDDIFEQNYVFDDKTCIIMENLKGISKHQTADFTICYS